MSAVLLFAGWRFIRGGNRAAHRNCMLAALGASALFLANYLYYHYHAGSVRFGGEGAVRTLYFCVLIPHTILAVAMLPMIARTLWLVWRGRFAEHAKIARWTLPIWGYVSVTGVVVYSMLYLGPWRN